MIYAEVPFKTDTRKLIGKEVGDSVTIQLEGVSNRQGDRT